MGLLITPRLVFPQKGSDYLEQIFNTDFMISVAAKIEVPGFDDIPAKLQQMEEFINTATVLPLDKTVTQQTIQLRRQYKKLKLGDAIIAATALVYNLVLITSNTADFKNIMGLEVLDPGIL